MSEQVRLYWQCRRGMLELDYLFSDFLSREYPLLLPAQQACFADLLKEPDPLLFQWLFQQPDSAPARYSTLLNLIRSVQGL